MKDKEEYSYEEVLGQYRREVGAHINDCQRIPSRKNCPHDVYHFAKALHESVYKDALHPSVTDEYKP